MQDDSTSPALSSACEGSSTPSAHKSDHGVKRILRGLLPESVLDAVRLLRDIQPGCRRALVGQFMRRLVGSRIGLTVPPILEAEPVVLVICRGNIYRSPMAAALFSRELDRRSDLTIRVRSAGLRARPQREAPADARAAAAVRGVSLETHQASVISTATVAEAALLVVMDYENEAEILARFPDARHRTILLGALDPAPNGGSAAIRDPYGRGSVALETCYSRLERAVRALHDKLRSESEVAPKPETVLRRTTRVVLASRPLQPIFELFARNAPSVFMLHRFADPTVGTRGHSPETLARRLEYLRKRRFNLSSLDDLTARLAAGEPPLPRTVVFTIDDGYADFERVGGPIFARFDCPATVFLISGFVDREVWMWWDKVRFLLGDGPRGNLRITVGAEVKRIAWTSTREREHVTERLVQRLQHVSTSERELALSELQRAVGQQLPRMPSAQYEAMTWLEIRSWESRNISFGAHTRTHPVLGQGDEALSVHEIEHSWSRLRTELVAPSAVFCYPFGKPGDYGPRERDIVKRSGMVAALTASSGHCTPAQFALDRFALPRLTFDENEERFRHAVGGLERVKDIVRGSGSGGTAR